VSDIDETPLVQDYPEGLGEVARRLTSNQDVPDSLWARIRDTWAAMLAERRRVNSRAKARSK
jgi:hypothetical protein